VAGIVAASVALLWLLLQPPQWRMQCICNCGAVEVVMTAAVVCPEAYSVAVLCQV